MPWILVGAAMAAVILVILVIDGLARLRGSSSVKSRIRRSGQSDQAYLLGSEQMARCSLGLPGLRIRTSGPRSTRCTESEEWDASIPPKLATDGSSHLWGLLSWLPDMVIRPEPVTIDAPPHEVWAVMLDFARYSEWNGFHRKMEILQKRASVGLRMTVHLGPLLGVVVETATIYYVDEVRHIFVYGVRGSEGPCSLRVVWFESLEHGMVTRFHSYDMIGGYPALLCRGHIRQMVARGFEEQHLALRDRVEALRRLAAEESAAEGSVAKGNREEASATEEAVPKARSKAEATTEADEALLAQAPLGACLVTGGCGFLGTHVVRMLCDLEGVSSVLVFDVASPRSALPPKARYVRGSVADVGALDAAFGAARPATVFHLASLLELRPEGGRAGVRARVDAVNVQGTANVLELARRHHAARLVYTSSIEVAYHDNSCERATEEGTPYPAHPTNGYQRTKIAAERMVLRAHAPNGTPDSAPNPHGLRTLVIRPTHIFGDPREDAIGRYLARVPLCFGEGFAGAALGARAAAAAAAPMSMVHVENCALAHVLGAARLAAEASALGTSALGASALGAPLGARAIKAIDAAGGRAYFVADFDANIVCLYRHVHGRSPPALCLPYWLLCALVHACLLVHIVIAEASAGRLLLLHPTTGLHHGALAAARTCTVRADRARRLIGYTTAATRDAAREAAAQDKSGGGAKLHATPILDRKVIRAAVANTIAAAIRPRTD